MKKLNQLIIILLFSLPPVAGAIGELTFDTLKQKAESGNAGAMILLADMYREGDKVEPDNQKALYWYKKSAEIDDGFNPFIAYTYRAIGNAYLRGEGVEEDHKQAFDWVLKGAEAGGNRSESLIGLFYRFGIGTTVDLAKAISWQLKAVEDPDDREPLLMYYLGVTYLDEGPTMNKIEGYKWLLWAAKQGNVKSQEKLDILCKESPWACK